MDDREKLVELFYENNVRCDQKIEGLADDVIDIIDHGVTAQEWVSVKDRLPEEKVNCIVYYQHAYCDNAGYWAIGFCFYDGEKFQMGLSYKVTHWQYLPQPPKGE